MNDPLSLVCEQLSILGNLPINCRITNRSGRIKIEEQTFFQSILRWIREDSRDDAFNSINSLVGNAFNILGMFNDAAPFLTRTDQPLPIPPPHLLRLGIHDIYVFWTCYRRLFHLLQHCVQGIKSLKTTYSKDANMQISLNQLIDKIHEQLHVVRRIIKATPDVEQLFYQKLTTETIISLDCPSSGSPRPETVEKKEKEEKEEDSSAPIITRIL